MRRRWRVRPRSGALGALCLLLAGCATPPSHPLADRQSQMAERALGMLGQPYRFGGAAPGGFDCSGLVSYAATAAALAVPRTAEQQSHVGTAVRRGDIRQGDLVFMHLRHKEVHVGIALDGSRFVHAPSTGGRVRIDSLAVPPYAAAFVQARRLRVVAEAN